MCRSNVIIYQNETKFEIYCNDKNRKPLHPPVTKESHYSIFYSSFLAYLHTYNRDNNNNNNNNKNDNNKYSLK
jgi:hypothetical protein